ncbi:MAG: hypothetical protein HC916_16900 [Coleofasciculaceae cyanobacterium SM2_1_6]|nr:hypothetical protein [Coleofasciculaceae cyanobacterium SM2_1_6]
MEINQSQGITLYAFLEAVAQQTAPLPEDLKQQMSQAGEIFTTDLNTAINQLANLAQHPHLQPIYELTRQQIQPDYQPQELNEYLPDPINPNKEPRNELIGYLDNVIVVDVLKSPDSEQGLNSNQGLLEKLRSLLFKKI